MPLSNPVVPADKQSAFTRILAFEASLSKRFGYSRMERYYRAWEYFTGANAPPESTDQPLGINLFELICRKHVHYLWGQWRDQLVHPRLVPGDPTDPAEVKACNQASDYFQQVLFRENEGNVLFQDASLDAGIFGDAFLKLDWDATANEGEGGFVLTTIAPEYVHLRWHPTDSSRVTEVIIAYPIAREDAYDLYGTRGNLPSSSVFSNEDTYGVGMYWERWTPWDYEVWIDNTRVTKYRVYDQWQTLPTRNPYIRSLKNQTELPGVIPIIHLPNLRGGSEPFGFADAENIILLQDELNRKLTDEGDIIHNHAHPIVLIRKWWGEPENELTVGPDEVWYMGREGEAEYLEWKGPASRTHEYITMLRTMLDDISHIPQAAHGRATQSQLSGIAAQMAMMPVTERAGAKRTCWTGGIRKLARVMGVILDARRLAGLTIPTVDPDVLLHRDVQSQWAPILPKDRTAVVNEQIALFTNNLALLEDTQIALDYDDVPERVKRLKDEILWKQSVGLIDPIQTASGGGPATGKDTVQVKQKAQPGVMAN